MNWHHMRAPSPRQPLLPTRGLTPDTADWVGQIFKLAIRRLRRHVLLSVWRLLPLNILSVRCVGGGRSCLSCHACILL